MYIKIDDICKTYKDGKSRVISPIYHLNMDIEKGDGIVITGPSGSGKTTLLNILGLLDDVDSGNYFIDSESVNNYSLKQKARLRNEFFGYIMQDYGLISYRNVSDNVSLPLLFNKNVKKNTYRWRIEEALEQVGILNYYNRNVNDLSGGEKQRVSIARAIVNNPEVLLADEPTGALDTNNKHLVIDTLLKLNDLGKTVIVVTHDMDVAKAFEKEYRFKRQGVVERIR